MLKNRYFGLVMAIALGVISGSIRVAAADVVDPFSYQVLTNLGPCTSSRVLLMNNDTNSICPIRGQGYHDTSNTVAVGQTYWWHDDTPLEGVYADYEVADLMNLKTGVNHILYQKRAEGKAPLKLWELKNCRAGSAACQLDVVKFNYLPWSSTCVPIDSGMCSGTEKIPNDWKQGATYSNGVKQVACITMRASVDAAIYSPLYHDGIGDVYFDALNLTDMYYNGDIAVDIATDVLPGNKLDFSLETDVQKLNWRRVRCEVFLVKPGADSCTKDDKQPNDTKIRLAVTSGYNSQEYYRVKVPVNERGGVRFRIVRTYVEDTGLLDFPDLVMIDNIIVSYPSPKTTLTPTGVDSEGTGFAKIGRVGAFTEPLLSRGLESAKPRMTYSVNTNGLPSFINWTNTVLNADFVWRWSYLNQASSPWRTDSMTASGDMVVGDKTISVTNRIGDIEYHYVADVKRSYYKFQDFGNDVQVGFPDEDGGTVRFRYPDEDAMAKGLTNYFSRIREGVSPWQEMHLEALVNTNGAGVAVVTNDWTMELISDHTWRGFVHTPTNYAGKTAHIRFVGKNMWETNGVKPSVEAKTWYFPRGEIREIPMGDVADTNLTVTGEAFAPDDPEQDIVLDASSGYLVFEFNDETGTFTMNRAEYQDFNKWTPSMKYKGGAAEEDKYIGTFVNTSYVGSVKQEYALDMSGWEISRSTAKAWGEDFDKNANSSHEIGIPFGLNKDTPNGWVAGNGMFINSMFSADPAHVSNRALQLQGRGVGTLSLIDPADVPQGIGTVSFTARLAQSIDFSDFYCYQDGGYMSDYAITAKASMTQRRQPFSDVSTGSPSLSLVTYYRPSKGCYEFRITRASAVSPDDIWNNKGEMRLDIYKWYRKYDSQTGSSWVSTNLVSKKVALGHFLVPPADGTNVIDNANWTSIYFAAYNTKDEKTGKQCTYLEGGVSKTQNSTPAYDELEDKKAVMRTVFVNDISSDRHTRGSYGLGSCECPATFGNIQRHELTGGGTYKEDDKEDAIDTLTFKVCPTDDKDEIKESIDYQDWGSVTERIANWGSLSLGGRNYKNNGGKYTYGAAASTVKQELHLSFAPHGNSSKWEKMLTLTLDSFSTNFVEFSPHTLTPANIQISVGGDQSTPRTDVVIDDVKVSQWAGEDSTDVGRMEKWAYTDAWISRNTEDSNKSAGTEEDDAVADVGKCGYYVKKIDDTNYIYVFTNTPAAGVAFTPKQDMTIKELFVLGGGGGGGPGGGGGGGGGAIWVTNAVDYIEGEGGIRIFVGSGGSGGVGTYTDTNPADSTAGGTSSVTIKDPFVNTVTEYKGYGGGRGGVFKEGADSGGNGDNGFGGGGGSARKNDTTAAGDENYASGMGGKAEGGGPGGGGGGGLRGTGSSGSNTPDKGRMSVIAAGTDGLDGNEGSGGAGGNGFSIGVLGDSLMRKTIGELIGNENGILAGGGGGGSGKSEKDGWDVGSSGAGGQGGGGQGGWYTTITLVGNTFKDPGVAQGAAGSTFGAGGGGGSFFNPVESGGEESKNWIIAGGAGGGGLVVMHVKIKDRLAILQPMRGDADKPMSIRTPFLNGISLLSLSWKEADTNALLRIQVATNVVNSGNTKTVTEDLDKGGFWTDVCDPIDFSRMDDSRRLRGSTNVLIGLRAPISGIARILVDPEVIKAARDPSLVTNSSCASYGKVIVTGMKVFDEPALDDRSWWGWNIMPTYRLEWSSLYDPVTLGPGRSCALNFSGKTSDKPEDDPLFAEDPSQARYDMHNPFVQTPRFTNGIGAVMFKARVLETNLTTESGWVTISASADPGEETDTNWVVLTNIEVTASTTIFEPYMFRLTNSISSYQALRLTAWGAAGGRQNRVDSGQPFGNHGTMNPKPIQRVLIDEVLVTQPMAPKLKFVNAYPFREGIKHNDPISNIGSPDQQPVLNETFGMQVQVVPAGMEDELDKSSIKVYMAWYAGEKPWGYNNWKNEKYAVKRVELKRAGDKEAQKDPENLVFRSHPDDAAAFIPPQQAGEYGYQIVQYHIWAEYKNKNNMPQEPCELSSDWELPTWYFGMTDFNKVNPDFSAYTVLDAISPKRAWINEINTFDGNTLDDKCQFIEFAVPQGFDMTGWSVQCIKNNDDKYDAKSVARFGVGGVVAHKSANATNHYAFIALQSPNTKAANKYSDVNDGTWSSTAFENGIVDVSNPYALRLMRPTGIIEHEVVFMSTNTATGRSWYTREGTNLLRKLKAALPEHEWLFYAGADAYGERLNSKGEKKAMSLGVYTSHGESESCWTNMMRQTPGKVNVTADGELQLIDPNYFKPPSGTNLWIYASIDPGSINSLLMVNGDVTNTSAVIIVPQSADGTFSTSIVYEVKKWFEMDRVVTNEYGKAGGEVPGVSGRNGVWTLDLSGLKMSDPENRKFEVMASVKDSSKIADLGDKGIAKDDPYYPAVVDWLQNYEEGDIRLAEFWLLDNTPYKPDGVNKYLLNLKQMYWLNIDPVGGDNGSGNSEWALKGGMSSGAYPVLAVTNSLTGSCATNIRCAVTLMITNLNTGVTRGPDMLRGLEPGSSSSNYNEKVSGDWNSVTFKITGALQNDKVNDIYRPLRWFTFGPDSFRPETGYTRVVDIMDPFSKRSPGYSYEWWKHPGSSIFYRWRIDHDTNRPPITVYQLNDDNALLEPHSN